MAENKRFTLPLNGTIHDLSKVPDDVFSSKVMGDGFAIEPTGNVVVAPFDGEIIFLYPTGHAVGFKSNDDIEILVHIGVDTVNMNGKGFEILKKQGDHVKAGEEIIKFNLKLIKKKAKSTMTPIVFTSGSSSKLIEELKAST